MSARGTLRIGTRASALALWQAHHVEALIKGLTGAPPSRSFTSRQRVTSGRTFRCGH
jgi:porphobilinogen deaminase